MSRRVLGVLAGEDYPTDLLKKWANSADIIIAADGGANTLTAVGVKPHFAVGDLDSISPEALQNALEIYKDSDQDCTDCDKLLRFADEKNLFPITLAGVEGDRLDHVFATAQSAARFAFRAQICIALRNFVAWPILPGMHSRDVEIGRKVSLIPLTKCEGVKTSGLRWELNNETLDPLISNSISNVSRETSIKLSLQSGCILMFVERRDDEVPFW